VVLAAGVAVVGEGMLFIITGAMIACVAIPTFQRWQNGTFDAFDPFFVLGSIYVVKFGFGAIWSAYDPTVAFDQSVVPVMPEASFYALLGVAAMAIGYHAFGRVPLRRAREEWTTGAPYLVLIGGVGLIGAIAGTQLFWLKSKAALYLLTLSQFSPMFLYAWALAWLLVFSGRATRGERLAVYLLFLPGVALIVLFSLSDKSLIMTLAVTPVVARWYTRRQLPWKTLLVLLLAMIFVVFPVINTFRAMDRHSSRELRATETMDTLASWDQSTYMDHSFGSFKSRLAEVTSLAAVVRDVPRWVPYAYGSTIFEPMLALFVPRMLWPDKPVFGMGREFGETFRIVSPLDEVTNVAVTVPGELYWNFSVPGVVFGMFLFGVVMRWAYRRYAEATLGHPAPIRQAFYVLVLIAFVEAGGGLAAEIVGLARTLVLLEALRWGGHYLGLLRDLPANGPATG